MLRASRSLSVGTPVLWLAALAGALLGVWMTQARAGACECVPPEWRLTLISERTSGEVVHAWPAFAHLEARPGTVVFSSDDMTTQTIDHLHAGEP